MDYLDVDEVGFVKMNQLETLLREDTLLVSIQHANHEIGTVQDIETIGNLCRAKNVLFHQSGQ